MTVIFDPSLPLGVRRPFVYGTDALAVRVRLVLDTRPGQIPWRPTFGCDLAGLVGYPATAQLIDAARSRISRALSIWLPDVEVVRVDVRAVSAEGGVGSRVTDRNVPVAESALMTLGVQAVLEADIELRGPDGYVSVTTTVEP